MQAIPKLLKQIPRESSSREMSLADKVADDEDDEDGEVPPAQCVAPAGFSIVKDAPPESLLRVGTAEHATLRGRFSLYNWPVVG
jgi:hypothetical protein